MEEWIGGVSHPPLAPHLGDVLPRGLDGGSLLGFAELLRLALDVVGVPATWLYTVSVERFSALMLEDYDGGNGSRFVIVDQDPDRESG